MKNIPYGHQNIDKNDISEVIKVLKSDWITQGNKIEEFENSIKKYTGAKYCVAVSSGTAALHISAISAGIKKNDEVITSPITFVASANCILYCGGKPVFADIDSKIPNIDPKQITKKLTNKSMAIIPVDYSGHPCDLKEIYDIAKNKNLTIIEDASHALGAIYNRHKIGSCKYSDMAVLSFHPVKHITTGEGGMVLTNNKELYDKLIALRNHGIIKDKKRLNRYDGPWYYEQHLLGYNYRITDFQSALGISQLKKLDKFISKRRQIVKIYNQELKDLDLLKLPTEKENIKSSWHIYYIQIKKAKFRLHLFNKLRKNNIGCQIHYIPVYYHPFYQKLGYNKYKYINAENFYNKVITIPLYPTMKEEEIKYIIETVKKEIKLLK